MYFLEKFTEPLPRTSRSRGHFQGRGGQILDFISIFNKFSFRIFGVSSFKVVWPQRPRRPQKGPSEFFQNQGVPTKKMRHVSALSEKFSLNLSTEEGWLLLQAQICVCNQIELIDQPRKKSKSMLLSYCKMKWRRSFWNDLKLTVWWAIDN